MSMVQQILPVVGQVSLFAVLFAMLAERLVKDVHKRKLIVAVLLVLCLFVPVNGLSISQWVRSALGDLSVLTVVILANIAVQRLFSVHLLSPDARKNLLPGIALLGVLFYPLALGLGPVDPYAFGFAPVWMTVLLVLASVMGWLSGRRDLAVILLLPLVAFNLQLLESNNLWDYLLDPILVAYAMVQVLKSMNFSYFKLRFSAAKVKN